MKRLFIAFLMLPINACYAQRIDSIKIVYCYMSVETPVSISPQWFEDGAFLNYRDSLVIKDSIVSMCFSTRFKHLKRYKYESDIDTRGKITFYFSNLAKEVWYYDRFLLQQKKDSIGNKWTKETKLFLNTIARKKKKHPIFQKDEIDVTYDDD